MNLLRNLEELVHLNLYMPAACEEVLGNVLDFQYYDLLDSFGVFVLSLHRITNKCQTCDSWFSS